MLCHVLILWLTTKADFNGTRSCGNSKQTMSERVEEEGGEEEKAKEFVYKILMRFESSSKICKQ